jgi:hypothetical protein
MGCPEWEDADFEGEIKDQFFPNWGSVKLNGFERPKWFAQGPLNLCIDYLIAKSQKNNVKLYLYWFFLNGDFNFLIPFIFGINKSRLKNKFLNLKNKFLNLKNKFFPIGRFVLYMSLSIFYAIMGVVYILIIPIIIVYKGLRKVQTYFFPKESFEFDQKESFEFDQRVTELIHSFQTFFPHREDQLKQEDLEPYRYIIKDWIKLFEYYDIIQAYATDPVLPMLAGNKPYIGFEHGTLRDFTLCNSQVCRNTALSYNLADYVFITNGDCLEYAKEIGVVNFYPQLHTVDDRRIRSVEGNYIDLHEKLGVKYVFLCPLRHDWQVKGTDVYIRALPKLVDELGNDDFRIIMTRWGKQIQESEALSKTLGVANLIEWTEPLHRHQLQRMLKSVDILCDQIMLPHFGATAPEGIASQVPVIMSYDPQSTAWLIPEPAPILSAFNVEQVIESVKKALNPDWLREYKLNAQEWIDKYHNTNIVVQRHLEAYQKVLSQSEN